MSNEQVWVTLVVIVGPFTVVGLAGALLLWWWERVPER